jgi:hypothetical protein
MSRDEVYIHLRTLSNMPYSTVVTAAESTKKSNFFYFFAIFFAGAGNF